MKQNRFPDRKDKARLEHYERRAPDEAVAEDEAAYETRSHADGSARPSHTLTIRLAKNVDGSATLSCVRTDGTTTWQRQRGTLGAFFPRHDLTHYAVETALGYRKGFYGLVAAGWDIGDFGAPWPRGPLPADMDPAELIVGFLDAERASRAAGDAPWTAADLTDQAANYYAARGIETPPPRLTDEQLATIRALMADLIWRWEVLAPGGALELRFDPMD